jgi:lipoprotein-anchoring transpeptidase ErfK/SrfK
VLFLVDESGNVTHILPVSTGNDKKYVSRGKQQTANTPRGDYKITRQIAGVRHAPLGDLYYPNYFLGGWAIHGSTSIPFLPASHGCVRIPNFAAEDFSHLVWVDMNVFVYD